MRTLDEVITGMTELVLSGKTKDVKEVVTDALKFLKEFRGLLKMWNDKLDKEKENNPLTWDELKTMEGKPVWITYEASEGGWVIVGKPFSLFEYDEPDAYIYMYYLKSKIECSKELYGSYWQAYRKERE